MSWAPTRHCLYGRVRACACSRASSRQPSRAPRNLPGTAVLDTATLAELCEGLDILVTAEKQLVRQSATVQALI